MNAAPTVQPLSRSHRNGFFYLLAAVFFILLPFLFLYATGYRFTWNEGELVSTGGLYVSVNRTGAEIYIDDELVRETRTFRTAFYAQNIEPGTHRIYVQKKDHHTWVKELPVYPHLVTEAQAFNLPTVPQIRTISPWLTVTGDNIITASSTLMASSTNNVIVLAKKPSTAISNTEYTQLLKLFISTSSESTTRPDILERVSETIGSPSATSSEIADATTTKEYGDVKLYKSGDDIFAEFIGQREKMPYYYCAENFELLSSSSKTTVGSLKIDKVKNSAAVEVSNQEVLDQPLQTVSVETECDPVIKIDRQNQSVATFDFFPRSSDLVIMGLEEGIYATEIDDRAWQNSQPLLLGSDLAFRVENSNVYVYDGKLIYQILIER